MRQPSTEPSDDELLDALYPRLRSYASRIADADVDPDDLVQDAVAATLARHRLVDLDHPEAYLRRCIFNTSANQRRRAGRLRRALGRLGTGDDHRDHYPSDLALLDELSPTDRAVLEMGDIDGTPHAAIADELGLSPGAVRKRAMRARTRLRYVVAVSLTILLAVAVASWFSEERGLDVTDDGDTTEDTTDSSLDLPGMEWPSRYLIEGLELTRVTSPSDVQGDDSTLFVAGTPGDAIDLTEPDQHTYVFAHAEEPYANPVFIATTAPASRTINTINSPTAARRITWDQVVVDSATPTAVEGSGYELAAEWEQPEPMLMDWWQLDFSDNATWQVVDHGGASDWFWIARLTSSADDQLEPIEVAGHPGVLITSNVGGGQGIVWSEGDVAHRVVAGPDAAAAAEHTAGFATRVFAATDDEWAAAQPGSQWYSVEQVGVPLPVVLVVLGSLLALIVVIVARNR
ncbi:MAG: RNA polymerase sigma factor [Acidimicrobiales bacterium]